MNVINHKSWFITTVGQSKFLLIDQKEIAFNVKIYAINSVIVVVDMAYI